MNSISAKPFSSAYANLRFLTPRTNLLNHSKNQISKKPKNFSFYLSCKLPFNPSNRFNSLIPFTFLSPVLRSIRSFATKATAINKLGNQTVNYLTTSHGGDVLQNGGIGVALLSVTATAKVRISPFVSTLAANPTFVSGLLAWFIAQSSKILLNFIVERKWDLRIFCSSGGMPSSHSALCTALTTSVGICHGAADSLFPVCLGFSLIVMYDAIGVRRHAGMQAEVLNKIIEDLFQGHPISERKLKELLGHTPSQVFAGALLGILVACFVCQGYWVAV